MEEKKLLKKAIILVFFAHKTYAHSFIALRLKPLMSHGLFYNVLTAFLGLALSVVLLSMEGQRVLGFHQKYLNLCSEDERRSYGFGTT